MVSSFFCRAIQAPIHGRRKWPARKGSSNWTAMVTTASPEKPPCRPVMRKATSSGVMKMPARLEKEALHTAAATLPRAMAVKAMDDCTVEGSRVRNSIPVPSAGSMPGIARTARPSSGNTAKVISATVRCSRQWRAPSITACRDRRAPCMKKRMTMPMSAQPPATVAAIPRTGRKDASSTMPTSSRI